MPKKMVNENKEKNLGRSKINRMLLYFRGTNK